MTINYETHTYKRVIHAANEITDAAHYFAGLNDEAAQHMALTMVSELLDGADNVWAEVYRTERAAWYRVTCDDMSEEPMPFNASMRFQLIDEFGSYTLIYGADNDNQEKPRFTIAA